MINRMQDSFVVIAVLVTVVILYSMTADRYLSNDSAQYLSTISQLLQGHGLKTTAIYYEVQAVAGIPGPQTVWPPGIALLGALAVYATGLDSINAMSLVNSIAHGLTVLLLYWILLQLGIGRRIAGFISLSYLGYWLAWPLALSSLSEPVYTLALLAVSACLLKAFDRAALNRNWLILASLTVTAALLIRYQAVVIVISLCLTVFFTLVRHMRIPGALVLATLLGVPALLVFLVLTIRNLHITGVLTGGPSAGEANRLTDIAIQLKQALIAIIGAGDSPYTRIAALILVLALVSWFGMAFYRGGWRFPREDKSRAVAMYGFSATFLTCLLVIGLSARTTVYVNEARYFSVLLPLFIVSMAAFRPATESAHPFQHQRAPSGLLGIAAAALVFLVIVNAKSQWGQPLYEVNAEALRKQLDYRVDGEPIIDLLRNAASLSTPVMSNQPQMMHIILRRPTVGVPEKRLTAHDWNSQEILALANKFQVEWLCILRKSPIGAEDGSEDYLWQLVGHEPAYLEKILMNDSVALYRFTQDSQ